MLKGLQQSMLRGIVQEIFDFINIANNKLFHQKNNY